VPGLVAELELVAEPDLVQVEKRPQPAQEEGGDDPFNLEVRRKTQFFRTGI